MKVIAVISTDWATRSDVTWLMSVLLQGEVYSYKPRSLDNEQAVVGLLQANCSESCKINRENGKSLSRTSQTFSICCNYTLELAYGTVSHILRNSEI